MTAEGSRSVTSEELIAEQWKRRALAAEPKAALFDEMLAALRESREHVLELSEAWRTGALSEHDGLGGTRSNRNSDVRVLLREVIQKADALTGKESVSPVLRAPFTNEQAVTFNAHQRLRMGHAFTCGKCGAILVALRTEIICPREGCDYTQDWMYDYMAAGKEPTE